VILAHLPRVTAATLVAGASLSDEGLRQLRAELVSVRRRGYLASVGGRLPAVAGLSVPVFGSAGIAGAVTVAGPAGRWGPEVMERAAAVVRVECATLSAALGTQSSPD
jgi:DNA-binding IclR family transcriptional regulator